MISLLPNLHRTVRCWIVALASFGQMAAFGQISVSMTASPDPVRPGEVINYVMTVVNRGSTTLNEVGLEQVLPAYMTRFYWWGSGPWLGVSGGDNYTDGGDIMTWQLGSLAAGQSKSVVFGARLASDAPPPNGTVIVS